MPTIVPTPVTPPEEVEIPPLPISGYTVLAQRTAWEVEPGYLPGACGFDGSAGVPFGDEAGEVHNITDIVFVGLFRGASVGQVIGGVVDMPVYEISETDAFSVTTTYPTPIPVGYFHPITSSFAVTTDPLQGPASNIGDGENYALVRQINSEIDNAAGTPTSADVIPRIREILYWRLWAAGPPDGTLLAMAVSATGRVVRAYRDPSDDIVLEFWRRSGWDAVTTSLSTTGSGAMTYDHQDNAGRLWLILEESGGIESRYTDDEGASFSVSTTIAATGTDPAICVSPTGLRHYYWRDSAAIKTKVLDSQNTAVVAATTVVASGVADSPIDAVHDGTLIHLTYKNTGNAVVTVVSSDGGLTFS